MTAVTLIEIPAWGTVSLVEFIWTLVGVVTVLYTAYHIPELSRDVRAVQKERQSLRAVARGYLRREIIRLLQGVCLTTIGVYAATQPSAFHGHDYITPTGIVLTSILFLMGFLVSAQSFWDWRTRKEVISHIHDLK